MQFEDEENEVCRRLRLGNFTWEGSLGRINNLGNLGEGSGQWALGRGIDRSGQVGGRGARIDGVG